MKVRERKLYNVLYEIKMAYKTKQEITFYKGCPMETKRSWVQPLHSTTASSELTYMFEVIEK